MNFRFSDEQLEFRRMLRDWVEKECPKSVARDLEGAEGQYPFELWDEMTAAGFHAIGIDPAYGGQGGSVIDQVLLCAELGRSLAGLTWIWGISSFAGAKSLTAFGSDEQKERFLPDLAEGKLRFAISVTEPGGGTDLLGALRTTAERCDGGWAHQRAQDLVHGGGTVGLPAAAGPHRSQPRPQEPGHHDLLRAATE